MKSFSFKLMNFFRFSWLLSTHLLFLTISFLRAESQYPESVVSVQIKSTADGAIQNALFYDPKVNHPAPLLVALHTWALIPASSIPKGANIMHSHYVFAVKRAHDGSIEKFN